MSNKLSEILAAAIEDAAAHVSSGNILNMDEWYHPRDGYCEACLAGAWLLGRHPEIADIESFNDLEMENSNDIIMTSLDSLRNGRVMAAFDNFYRFEHTKVYDCEMDGFKGYSSNIVGEELQKCLQDLKNYVAVLQSWEQDYLK